MKGIPDKAVDLVLTDPPYGMSYVSSRRKHSFDAIADDDNTEWFPDFAKEAYRVLKNDTHLYVFCNDYAISTFRNALTEAGFTVKRTLVWVKNNHTSGDLEGDYGNKTEFILFAHKGRRLLEGKRETNVILSKRVAELEHPTEKPIDLLSYLVSKSSSPNDIVLDPFAGGGSTCIAASQKNRYFIGIELMKEYCQIAETRLSAVQVALF